MCTVANTWKYHFYFYFYSEWIYQTIYLWHCHSWRSPKLDCRGFHFKVNRTSKILYSCTRIANSNRCDTKIFTHVSVNKECNFMYLVCSSCCGFFGREIASKFSTTQSNLLNLFPMWFSSSVNNLDWNVKPYAYVIYFKCLTHCDSFQIFCFILLISVGRNVCPVCTHNLYGIIAKT